MVLRTLPEEGDDMGLSWVTAGGVQPRLRPSRSVVRNADDWPVKANRVAHLAAVAGSFKDLQGSLRERTEPWVSNPELP